MARAMALATVTRLPLEFFSQLVTPSFSSWGCGSIRRNLPSSFSESKRGLGWETSGNCREERAVIVFLSQQSDSQPDQKTVVETVEANSSFLNKDDVKYLFKLLVGSIGAAIVIKYGSVLFPDITKPDLLRALVIITAPVIISIIVLLKKSSSKISS